MSEENKNVDLGGVKSALSGFSSMLSSDTISKLNEIEKNKATPPADNNTQPPSGGEGNPPAGQPPVDAAPEGNIGEEPIVNANEPKPEGSGSSFVEGTFEVESPLLGGKQKIGNQAVEPGGSGEPQLKIENLESLNSILKDKYGIEKIDDLPSKLDDYKQKSEEVNKLTERISNVESLFQTMPPQLYGAIEAFIAGKDWQSAVSSSSLDLSKPKDSYSEKDLVSHLSQEQITEDDWQEFEDPDGDPAVKRLVQTAINTAKSMYDLRKSEFEKTASESVLKAKEFEQKFKSSIDSSKQNLMKHFPTAESALVSDMDSLFTEKGIGSVFYNQDGTLKEDAYTRLAMAQHGAELIEQYKKIAERQIETQVNERILSRGADTPSTSKGTQAVPGGGEIRKEVQEKIDAIRSLKHQQGF